LYSISLENVSDIFTPYKYTVPLDALLALTLALYVRDVFACDIVNKE
jgi:hypothetical protein